MCIRDRMESMDNMNNGTLSGNCDIDVNECKSSPCKNGATCTDSTTESAVSYAAYQCTCVSGFANGVCEYTNYLHETKPNKDHDFIKEFRTECTVMESLAVLQNSKLTGNCDIDVNECKSSPCKNGATCTDSTTESAISYHAYQCTCVSGFANGVCEYTKNPKKPSKFDFIKEYKTECTVSESMDLSLIHI